MWPHINGPDFSVYYSYYDFQKVERMEWCEESDKISSEVGLSVACDISRIH